MENTRAYGFSCKAGPCAAAIVTTLCVVTSVQAGGSITNLGTFGGTISVANAVSGNGSAVVGYSSNASSQSHAFLWTAAGLIDLGTIGNSESVAFGISGDGTTVVGSNLPISSSDSRAFRWTSAGMADLGSLVFNGNTDAYAVNGDGSVVTGRSGGLAFRWTNATGMQDIGNLGSLGAVGNAISLDGMTIVGSGNIAVTGTTHAFRWTNAWMQDLGTLGGASWGTAVSADGSAAAGYSNVAAGGITHAFRWTEATGMLDLGTLGVSNSYAFAMSGDGSTVGGYGFVPGSGEPRAFIWTAKLGMVDLNTYLPSVGVNLAHWTLRKTYALSADGSTIAGVGTFNGFTRAFLVKVCGSDFDHDGFVTGDDYDSFVLAFEAGLPTADFNNDGFVSGEDFDAFVSAFEAGC